MIQFIANITKTAYRTRNPTVNDALAQGRCAEAVKEYIRATRLCPSDPRALALLDDLFAENKEAVDGIPNFRELLIECHELVRCAKGESLLQ